MSVIVSSATVPDRLIAPRTDGAILSHPMLPHGVRLARENAERLQSAGVLIGKRSLEEFRRWARAESLAAARNWMSRHLGIEFPVAVPEILIVTGHQPQLNHPGVWMKNVAAARLAECSSGQGLNLIVDNDLAAPPMLRCPAGTRDEPRLTEIPFDLAVPAQPWEELRVRDGALFASFARRVEEAMAPWGIAPLLTQMWPAAVGRQQQGDSLANCLSACRIRQEREWHVRNLELPVSVLCQTEPFLVFVASLCQNVERFFAAYNQGVQQYRQKYRVRNSRHPVPDLERQGDLWELPFWYWEPDDHDRTRLFVRRNGQKIELWGKDRILTTLSADEDDVSPLMQLQQSGRLRTRALTTTLYSRLCLGDLFIHGIGGARYDEITDGLMTSCFGMIPPAFITLTATLHLPIDAHETTAADVSRLKQEMRHLEFSGDDHDDSPEAVALRAQRSELLQSIREERRAGYSRSQRRMQRAEHRRRHLELVRIQKELAARAETAIQQRRCELEHAEKLLRANAILCSREFSAALFPEDKLHQLVQDVQRLTCGRETL